MIGMVKPLYLFGTETGLGGHGMEGGRQENFSKVTIYILKVLTLVIIYLVHNDYIQYVSLTRYLHGISIKQQFEADNLLA